MVTHEVNDEIEHLRFDMDGFTKPAQLLLAEIDFELGKSVFITLSTSNAIREMRSRTHQTADDTNRAKTITSQGKIIIFSRTSLSLNGHFDLQTGQSEMAHDRFA